MAIRKSRKALTAYPRMGTNNTDEVLTEQHHKDRCDINNIIKRFARTNRIDHISKYEPLYTEIPATDLLSAELLVQRARTMFNELPAKVREKFQGDPKAFLRFMQDPANKAEWSALGLLNPTTRQDATIQDVVDAVSKLAPADPAAPAAPAPAE